MAESDDGLNRKGYQSTAGGLGDPSRYVPLLGGERQYTSGNVRYNTTSTVEAGVETGTVRENNPLFEPKRKDEDPDMGWLTTSSINFSDIVKEQRGTESIEQGKKVHRMVFHFTRDWLYKILVLLTGVLLAFGWGLLFGSCSYVVNWLWSPLVRFSKTFTYAWGILGRAVIRGACSPFYSGVDFVWNSLRLTLSKKNLVEAGVSATAGGIASAI
ncbi:caveolin-3-like [Sycon ciliatum]|uniref:caveolin-3-like n=1 Tax=Sycon ciliatum TaxID=27933 RepID=UPI0031F6A06C